MVAERATAPPRAGWLVVAGAAALAAAATGIVTWPRATARSGRPARHAAPANRPRPADAPGALRESALAAARRELAACRPTPAPAPRGDAIRAIAAQLAAAPPDRELRQALGDELARAGVDPAHIDATCGGDHCRVTVARDGEFAFRDAAWAQVEDVDGDAFHLVDAAIDDLGPRSMRMTYLFERTTRPAAVLELFTRVEAWLATPPPGCAHGEATVTLEIRAGQLMQTVLGPTCLADAVATLARDVSATGLADMTATRQLAW